MHLPPDDALRDALACERHAPDPAPFLARVRRRRTHIVARRAAVACAVVLPALALTFVLTKAPAPNLPTLAADHNPEPPVSHASLAALRRDPGAIDLLPDPPALAPADPLRMTDANAWLSKGPGSL